MSENQNPFTDQETIKVSVTVTRDFAERLADEYTGSLSLSEEMRDAAEDAVNYREQKMTPKNVTESTLKALEQAPPIAVDTVAAEQPDER